jgi:hypothetical protein
VDACLVRLGSQAYFGSVLAADAVAVTIEV